MRAILSLFVQSPFAPLQKHMEEVSCCLNNVTQSFNAYFSGKQELVEQYAKETSQLEHAADLTKNHIRNHLPKSLFLPVDRGHLLEILAIQDGLADKAEDITINLTCKAFEDFPSCQEQFTPFLQKNMEAFEGARRIIDELNELVQSSFGGNEAEKVKATVDTIAFLEHEADLMQHTLIKSLYNAEEHLSYTAFAFWSRLIEEVGAIADLSEKLANRIRMTLDLS